MDVGSKLGELKLTTDELKRFSKAMKDEKFRELLHDYAQEISNPENRKMYEEEITQLEQERGNEVKFIHPSAHHVLKTSVNGKEKCFINICSNNLINKPKCEAGRAENGQLGQCWSLPYSLTPGRPDRDHKDNEYTIYDVVFHPDTLSIADKSKRFMQLVNSTAIQGVENAFKVTLDKAHKILKKVQYKGVPQPAVIRKQIPGQPRRNESSPCDDAFNIPYPDTMPIKIPEPRSPSSTHSSAPIQPHYNMKYRSFVDMQDYRCSRDSTPNSRPKEIIITVNLPLLESAADADLNVTERKLTLQSRNPNYKLELDLSYPVDEDKGDAKFNKAKKQLIITLTVQPAENYALDHNEGNQPDNNDVLGTADESDETVYGAIQFNEGQSEVNVVDVSCEAYRQESGSLQEENVDSSTGEVESFKANTFVSKTETLHLAKADATLTCEKNNTEMCRSSEKATDGPQPNACTEDKFLEPHGNKEPDNNHNKEMVPVVDTQREQAASHSEETLLHVQNSPANSSGWVPGKSEVESSLISDGSIQTKLLAETMTSLCELKKNGELPEDQNSSIKLDSSTVPLNKQVDNLDSSKQSKTDPAILEEKNSEDGSEVIMERSTSAALSFQNTVRFELD